MPQNFFIQRPKVTPTIYAYRLIGVYSHDGYLKIGYTDRDAETRVKEQLHTSGVPYQIVLKESAMRADGTCFTDHDIHAVLRRKGFFRLNEGDDKNEWFRCSERDVLAAIHQVRDGIFTQENRTATFKMRPEQQLAVQKTMDYFASAKKEEPNKAPKFLWNAKMRFGKTFATYQLAKKMGLKRVLVLTFKPAVESAWREDLLTHVDFEGWQFISNKDAHDNKVNIDRQYEHADKSRPIVVFGSFQDLLGTNENGGIKTKNEFIHRATTGISSCSTNTTSAHGAKTQKNCLKTPTKKRTATSTWKNTSATKRTTPITRPFCPSRRTITSFCPARPSAP